MVGWSTLQLHIVHRGFTRILQSDDKWLTTVTAYLQAMLPLKYKQPTAIVGKWQQWQIITTITAYHNDCTRIKRLKNKFEIFTQSKGWRRICSTRAYQQHQQQTSMTSRVHISLWHLQHHSCVCRTPSSVHLYHKCRPRLGHSIVHLLPHSSHGCSKW